MPASQTSPVGALTLPVPAGDSQEQFTDPVVAALLDFLAWSLTNDLDSKLANLTATDAAALSISAPDNRYPFDPFHPRGHHIKRNIPALYVWWPGDSTVWRPNMTQLGRARDIHALYVVQEMPQYDEMERRVGLMSAVDASWLKAANRGAHPSYSYNSKPNGTPLEDSTGEYSSWEWEYIGGQAIRRVNVDDPNTAHVGGRAQGQSLPGFAAMFRVRELVLFPIMTDPDDVTTDSTFSATHNGADIDFDRVLEAPDGDEALP